MQGKITRTRDFLGPILLLAAITSICYVNSIGCGFVYDDKYNILNDPLRQSPHPVMEAFRLKMIVRAFSDAPGWYRPFYTLSLWANGFLSREAWAYHLVNLIFHLVCVVSLYFLTLRFRRRRDLAFVTALLFAVWPTHVEAVTWISARNHIASAAFILAALLAVTSGRYLAYAVLASAAILFKELSVILPLSYLVAVIKTPKRVLWPHLVPLGVFVLSITGRMLAHWSPDSLAIISSSTPTPHAPLWKILVGSLIYIGTYLRMSVIPMAASIPASADFSPSTVVITAVTFALVFVVLWLVWRKRQPEVWMGLTWFAATSVFATPITYSQLQMCDRYVYMPQMGIAFAIGAVMLKLGKVGKWIIALLAIAGCVLTVGNNRIWQDEVSYYSYIVQKCPTDAGATNNLAQALMDNGRVLAAITVMEKAVKLAPKNPVGHANLGSMYIEIGRPEDGIREIEAAHRLAPENKAITQALENLRRVYVRK